MPCYYSKLNYEESKCVNAQSGSWTKLEEKLTISRDPSLNIYNSNANSAGTPVHYLAGVIERK